MAIIQAESSETQEPSKDKVVEEEEEEEKEEEEKPSNEEFKALEEGTKSCTHGIHIHIHIHT